MLTNLLTGLPGNWRDQGVKAGTREPEKPLLTHTGAHWCLRGEKGEERLRAWCREWRDFRRQP